MKKLDITVCKTHASTLNGNLISTEYVNSRTKLIWQCEKGHQWKARWNDIKDGRWCPKCAKSAKPTIQQLRDRANQKNGKLLSTKYVNNQTKLRWRCEKGHIWSACWDSVQNSWCPVCSGRIGITINKLQQFAVSKQGLLISSNYSNNHTNLIWQCEKGHQWEANWNSISSGRWCPKCSSYKTENLCRTILETIYGFSFIKTRFKYKNKQYEFDGYNREHNIAFEYHGYQHYMYPNHWHKSKDAFDKARQRDTEKEKYCKENDITLLIIPYTQNSNLDLYIRSICAGQ